MPIKEIVISALKAMQSRMVEKYNEMEEMQGEFPEFHSIIQDEMDAIGWKCELARRTIYELEGKDG